MHRWFNESFPRIVLCAAFLALTLHARAEASKIGVILPLSGNAASYGQQFKDGLELAAQKNPSFKFFYEDSRFDSKTALTAFRKLVDVDRIDVLFSFGGATCEVLNQEAQRRRILHLASGCNTAQFSTPDSFNFRLDVDEETAARKTAEYLKREGITRVVFLYVDNSWAGTIIKFTRRAFQESGITILADVPFAEDSSVDLRSSLVRIRSLQPQLLFLISLPDLTPLVLKQIEDLGFQIPIMSNISVENPEVVRLARKRAEGIVYLSVRAASASHERFAEFYQRYPNGNPFAAWGFDSVLMLTEAWSSPSPRRYLQELKDFVGAFNIYSFDDFGELHLSYEIKEIKDGSFVSKAGL